MTEQSQQQAIRKARIITLAEAKEILSKVDPDKADQIQKRTVDYLAKFAKTEPDRARKIRTALVEQTGLTLDEATELANIMPGSQEELRVFTAGWRKLIPTATVEKIVRILTE
ncbi:MAG: RNA polymerase Rpb4 [Nitrososphaerales archaeon]